MSVTTSTAPELTTEQVQKILVTPLEQASLFLAAGPRIFDTPGQPVRVPKLGGAVSVDWVGESEEIPSDEEVGFDEVELLPSSMKSAKVIVRYSNELARSSVVSLDSAIRQRLVTDVAAKIDGQFFGASGDGTTTPQGLFAWSGTQSVAVGGALTLDHLIDAWGKALSANVNVSALKWVMTPREFIALRKIKTLASGSNQYVLTPDPTQDGVFRLFGSEVIVTGRVPDATGTPNTGRAALLDFSQVAVARDLAPSVTVLRERYADFDEQALRVVARYDAKPLNSEAVVKLTGITIS
jgi:HK97 family phage major capsid protein